MLTTAKIFSLSNNALIAVALGLLVSTANAQPAAGMQGDMKKSMPTMDAKQGMDTKQGMDMKHGMDMKSMMSDMSEKMTAMKPTGNVDVDFAMMMRVHHQSAVTMAEAELQNGKDPQMRVMAKDIIRAQKKEIAVFDKFLAKRGEPGMKMGSPAMQMGK